MCKVLLFSALAWSGADWVPLVFCEDRRGRNEVFFAESMRPARIHMEQLPNEEWIYVVDGAGAGEKREARETVSEREQSARPNR